MRRTLCLLAALWLTACGGSEPKPRAPARAAEPQQVELDWRESYPATGKRLVFVVDRLAVRKLGWSVDIAVTNSTSIPFAAGVRQLRPAYGLMLFATDDLAELEQQSAQGGLPPLRRATTIEPEPPSTLAPGETWRATLAGRGSLPAGSYVRVSLGPFQAVGEPPEGMERSVVWITDHAHGL